MRFQTLLLVLPASILLAQTPAPPQPPAPKLDQVKTALGLSDDQVTQLIQLRRDERQALHTTLQTMRDKRKALHDALQAGGADAATLGNLLLDIQNLQKQVKATNTDFHTRALASLNDAKKQKLQSLEDAEKLRPAIGQAVGLNLLQGPQPGAGPFFRDRGMMRGPGMMGGAGLMRGPGARMQNFRSRRGPRQ